MLTIYGFMSHAMTLRYLNFIKDETIYDIRRYVVKLDIFVEGEL